MLAIQKNPVLLKLVDAVQPEILGVEASVVGATYFDLVTETVNYSSSYQSHHVETNNLLNSEEIDVENLSPTILDVTNWPHVTRITAGLGCIRLSNGRYTATRMLDVRNVSGGGSSYNVTGFVSGTVGALTWSIIESLLVAGGDSNLLSGGVVSGNGWDFRNSSYNPLAWHGPFDFSGVSHYSYESASARKPGVLITERHALFANHYCPPAGSKIVFIAPDGTKHERTIMAYNEGARISLFNASPVVSDMAIAVLDAALPASIKVYAIIDNWIHTETVDSLGRASTVHAWVGFKVDQQRRIALCGVSDTYPITEDYVSGQFAGQSFPAKIRWGPTDFPVNASPQFLYDYSNRVIPNVSGDSGCPRFLPLSAGNMALVGCVASSNGFSPFPRKDAIDAMIVSADAIAGIASTGLTATVSADPTL